MFSLFSLAGCPVKKHPYYRGLEERSLGAPIRRRRQFKSGTRNPKLTFKFRETHPSFRCVKLEYLQLVTIPNVLGRNNTWIRGGRRSIFRFCGRGVTVAARDLKSRDFESCGFESHRPHCVYSSMVEQRFVVPHMWVQFPLGTAGVAESAYAHG